MNWVKVKNVPIYKRKILRRCEKTLPQPISFRATLGSVKTKGPSTLATLFSHRWPRFCGGDIYSRRKPLFSSFGEHTAVCGSSVRQAVARPRHRQSVCIHNIHVALVCSGPPQKRGHLWLDKVASVLGP